MNNEDQLRLEIAKFEKAIQELQESNYWGPDFLVTIAESLNNISVLRYNETVQELSK